MRDEISNNYDTIDEKRRLLLSIAYGKEPVSDDVISIISEMAETSVNHLIEIGLVEASGRKNDPNRSYMIVTQITE